MLGHCAMVKTHIVLQQFICVLFLTLFFEFEDLIFKTNLQMFDPQMVSIQPWKLPKYQTKQSTYPSISTSGFLFPISILTIQSCCMFHGIIPQTPSSTLANIPNAISLQFEVKIYSIFWLTILDKDESVPPSNNAQTQT